MAEDTSTPLATLSPELEQVLTDYFSHTARRTAKDTLLGLVKIYRATGVQQLRIELDCKCGCGESHRVTIERILPDGAVLQ